MEQEINKRDVLWSFFSLKMRYLEFLVEMSADKTEMPNRIGY